MPASACVSPRRTRIRVVLPAPLGPRHPNAHPRGTRSSTLLTAMFGPKCLVSPCVSTAHPSLGLPSGTIEGALGGLSAAPLSRRPGLFPMDSPGGRPRSVSVGFAGDSTSRGPDPELLFLPRRVTRRNTPYASAARTSRVRRLMTQSGSYRTRAASCCARSNEHRGEVGVPGRRNAGHSSGRDLSQLPAGISRNSTSASVEFEANSPSLRGDLAHDRLYWDCRPRCRMPAERTLDGGVRNSAKGSTMDVAGRPAAGLDCHGRPGLSRPAGLDCQDPAGLAGLDCQDPVPA